MKTEFFFSGLDDPTTLTLNENEREKLNRCLAFNDRWFITENGHKVNLFNVDWINYVEEVLK